MHDSTIRSLAPDERPRERLLTHGAGALSNAELVAVLLRTGRRGQSALDMARALLRDLGGLDGIGRAGADGLRREGLGDAKATTLLSAAEIGRRLARCEVPERRILSRPHEVSQYLALRYGCQLQEVMGALYVDSRNRLVGERELFRGTATRAVVEPRPILKEALLRDASGMVLFHTHPSGDPSPSTEDLLFTRRVATAGEAVGVRLLDHLVIGYSGLWVSLRDRGAW